MLQSIASALAAEQAVGGLQRTIAAFHRLQKSVVQVPVPVVRRFVIDCRNGGGCVQSCWSANQVSGRRQARDSKSWAGPEYDLIKIHPTAPNLLALSSERGIFSITNSYRRIGLQ